MSYNITEEALKKIEKDVEALREMMWELLENYQPPREWLTPNELVPILDLKPDTIRLYLREGRIKGEQRGRGRGGKPEWFVHREEVRRFQERDKPHSPSEGRQS